MRKPRAFLARALVKMAGAREPVLSPSLLVGPAEVAHRKTQSEKGLKGRAPRRRKRARRLKESIQAKARERSLNGPGFRGTFQKRKGLMPSWAETVADLPDTFVRLPWSGQVGILLFARGWVVGTSGPVLRYDLPPVNKASGLLRPAPRHYALTEAGKTVRAWLQWVRARRVMGWPCPVMGKRGEYIALWIEGADIPAKRPKVKTTGYLPGDEADEAWPGFTGSLRTAESGSSGTVVSKRPD